MSLTTHTLSKAACDVLDERQRQISAEGWTPEHDDQHGHGEMAMAAACYAAHSSAWQAIQYRTWVGRPGMQAGVLAAQEFVRRMWPWAREWWKPKDDRRNLVRAAALLLAEIERLDRASPTARGVALHSEASDGACNSTGGKERASGGVGE